jgi:hypothetical protein
VPMAIRLKRRILGLNLKKIQNTTALNADDPNAKQTELAESS